MGCPSCSRSRKDPQPVRNYVPPAPAKRSTAPKPVPQIISVAARERHAERICEKCGWMWKRIRYIDVKTSTIVEKFCCPNRHCTEFQVEK